MAGKKTFVAGEVLLAQDVNDFLMDQSVMNFASSAARASAIPTPTEGMVAYLQDSNTLDAYNATNWVTVGNAGANSYSLSQTLFFTSSGSFTKATYPWLRAIKVMVQAGGGGGASTNLDNSSGGAGGGGGYTQKFITDIAGLDSSITITIGAGGSGGAAGNNNGSAGGNTSFGSLLVATGGGGGSHPNQTFAGGGVGGGASTAGDVVFGGSGGGAALVSSGAFAQPGGSSFLGGGGQGQGRTDNFSAQSGPGTLYGGGGAGAVRKATSQDFGGAAGAAGIVIIELYA
jgi:hypothetical protein